MSKRLQLDGECLMSEDHKHLKPYWIDFVWMCPHCRVGLVKMGFEDGYRVVWCRECKGRWEV